MFEKRERGEGLFDVGPEWRKCPILFNAGFDYSKLAMSGPGHLSCIRGYQTRTQTPDSPIYWSLIPFNDKGRFMVWVRGVTPVLWLRLNGKKLVIHERSKKAKFRFLVLDTAP